MSKLSNYHLKLGKKKLLNRAAIICFAGAVLVAFSGLLGWIPGLEFLGNISPHFIPMAPTTSIAFILLGLILLIFIRYRLQGWSRFSAVAVTLLLSVFGIIELAEHFTGIDVENFFIPDAGMLELMRKARMSPATGATFFFSGVATLLVLLGETKKKQVKRICSCAGIVGSFVTITGATILMSYLYGNPLLYGGETIPMAATTAIGFVFLGAGLVAAVGPDYMPVRLLVGHFSRAKLLRVFLPLSILIVLSQDILHRFVFVHHHTNSVLLSVLSLMFFVGITGVIVTVVAGAIGRALDAAEEKVQSLARFPSKNPNPVLRISSDGVVLFANEASRPVLETWGVQKGQRLPHDCYKRIEKVVGSCRSSNFELECSNGRIFLITLAPVAESRDVNAYGLDITERKQAEEVLRESEEKVRTLYDSSSDTIMLLDEKGFFDCNDATLRLFGCASREEFCSRHPADFSPPTQPCGTDSLTLANQRIATAMQTGCNRFEWMHKRIDSDEAFPADVLFDAMELGGKKVLQARVYDITERKKAEGELERLNKQLESAVEELSIANRELKDFAHITAHDLKAPLRGIGTLAEWLATDYADKFDEEGKKQVGLLVQRSQEMYDQISGILHFSEIGQGTHEKEEIDLNRLIEKIITSVNPPENIQITIADKLPTLICAQVPLTQVFQNLLSNAIDYADKAEGQVTIGCVEEGDFWKFNVTDNGPGIEEQYFDKIFQIFQTLPVKGEHRGTGIGLAIVRKAVEMYGGKIWVESAPGQGTTFFFTFPKQEMKVACDEKLEANIVG